MIFKPLSNFSRHAALAKHLWVQSAGTNQPSQPSAFFLTTHQLARQQSQITVRNDNAFGGSEDGHGYGNNNSATTSSYASVCSSSSFPSISPLSSLDDEKQKEILAESTGTGSSSHGYMIYNHQRSLVRPSTTEFRRRYSIARDEEEPGNQETKPETENDTMATATEVVTTTIPSTNTTITTSTDTVSIPSHVQASVTSSTPSNQVPSPTSQPQHISDSEETVNLKGLEPGLIDSIEDAEKTKIETFSSIEQEQHSEKLNESPISTAPSSVEYPEEQLSSKIDVDDNEEISIVSSSSQADNGIFQAFSKQDYERVVEIYRSSLNSLSINAFNKVLESISYISEDATSLLDAYSALLGSRTAGGALPNVETYSILINNLIDNADKRQKSELQYINLRDVKRRHNQTELLNSVSEELERIDVSSMHVELALELFEASNTVTFHEYPISIYTKLINACVNYGQVSKLKTIVDSIRVSLSFPSTSLSSEIEVGLLKAFSKDKDLDSAVALFNNAQNSSSSSSYELYSAMIGAYFECNEPALGVKLLKDILSDKRNGDFVKSQEFESILAQVFQGFAKLGESNDAWRWIQQAESDPNICTISLETLIETFSIVCNNNNKNDSEVVHNMFDFMASYKTSTNLDLFNDTRCDYLMYCVRQKDNDSIYKAIRETHVRDGVWDETTLVSVVQYLISIDESELGLDVFQMQSFRIKKYFADRNLSNSISYSSFGEEALGAVVLGLKDRSLLNAKNAVALSNCGFMNARVFANPNGGGIDILEAIWEARRNESFLSIYKASRTLALDILRLHITWIQSSTQSSSLGGLSIPTELLQKLKENFALFVKDVISNKLPVSKVLVEDVQSSLQLLDDYESVGLWKAYISDQQQSEQQQHQQEVLESQQSQQLFESQSPIPLVNVEASNQIIAYSRTKNGILQSLNLLRDVFIRKELVTPDSILFLIESVGTSTNPSTTEATKTVVQEIYGLCLQYLPHPASSPQAWDAWNSINRSVVQVSAEIDYSLAENAYFNLLEMGSCPDATGYGQLMSHSPTNNNRDEASDAMRMFNQAKSNGIQLNTFLYNVLLSKLSKARKLKEAVAIFQEMDNFNIKKTSVSYGTMISACCRAGDGESAMKLFQEMESSSSYVPKVAPFNIMLQYYVHTKRDREAGLKIYEKLRGLGLTPSAHTYKLLIDMFSTISPIDMESADNMLLAIKEDGNEVTSQHFAALLFARGVGQQDLASAQKFYETLVYDKRVRPDKVIFQALLESYVINDKVRDTPKVLKEMVKYAVDLNAYMANILIRGWASVSIDKSVGLFDFILQSNIAEPSSYESIIRAFIYHGDYVSAENVLDLMRTNRYPEVVVQKVEHLIRQGSNDKLQKDRVLLDSIFRQDPHRLHQHN